MGDSIWGPDKPVKANDELREIYIDVLKSGGVLKTKAMNVPIPEGEHISGAKDGEKPRFITN